MRKEVWGKIGGILKSYLYQELNICFYELTKKFLEPMLEELSFVYIDVGQKGNTLKWVCKILSNYPWEWIITCGLSILKADW